MNTTDISKINSPVKSAIKNIEFFFFKMRQSCKKVANQSLPSSYTNVLTFGYTTFGRKILNAVPFSIVIINSPLNSCFAVNKQIVVFFILKNIIYFDLQNRNYRK